MWPNQQFLADLVSFTEEILNGKLHFLCSVIPLKVEILTWNVLSKLSIHSDYKKYQFIRCKRKTFRCLSYLIFQNFSDVFKTNICKNASRYYFSPRLAEKEQQFYPIISKPALLTLPNQVALTPRRYLQPIQNITGSKGSPFFRVLFHFTKYVVTALSRHQKNVI